MAELGSYCDGLDWLAMQLTVEGLQLREEGLAFRVWGLGIRVKGLGFRDNGKENGDYYNGVI